MAGIPAHVAGGFPPAVLTRKTSSRSPVVPSFVRSFSQATAPKPVSSCPTGAPGRRGDRGVLRTRGKAQVHRRCVEVEGGRGGVAEVVVAADGKVGRRERSLVGGGEVEL